MKPEAQEAIDTAGRLSRLTLPADWPDEDESTLARASAAVAWAATGCVQVWGQTRVADYQAATRIFSVLKGAYVMGYQAARRGRFLPWVVAEDGNKGDINGNTD